VVRPGDTWWSIAERAYGDGRLYRALFAWNRTVDPRITLAPGTPLEIPPLPELAAAWPHLLPARP
jgi:nucleoid-associated protein YgaU